MKTILLFFALFSLHSCHEKTATKQSSEGKWISFKISADYCGGANPGPEIIRMLKTPKPAKNEQVVIKASATSEIKERVTTNELGIATTQLPPGRYSVYLMEKLRDVKSDDPFCAKWKNTPSGILEITSADSTEVLLKRTCNPCYSPSM